MAEHADMTVHGTATLRKLMTEVGATTPPDLAALADSDEFVYVDCVRDMKFRSGICFISKELAIALGMKKGQRGQLVWIP